MSQPTVAKHLRVLREAGFVESTVDAQRRLYHLKPEPLQELDAWLAPFRRFWSAKVVRERGWPSLGLLFGMPDQEPNFTLRKLKPNMKTPVKSASRSTAKSASASIDNKINKLGDWRGETLAKLRRIILAADSEIVEEWKWAKPSSPGTPVWSRGGILCTGETYKNAVKMTFAKGASLPDPAGLFNSSLQGKVRRAIDFHQGDRINGSALRDLIRAAVALNLRVKAKSQ